MTQHIVDEGARDLAREAKNVAVAAQSQISSHERECAIFRAASTATLKDIKNILAWGITALIGAMGTLIAWLAIHPPH